MTRLRPNEILLIFFETFLRVSAITHFAITENGRIESQPDSIFNMRRPYDLPTFLDHEIRLKRYLELHEKVMARNNFLDSEMATLNSVVDAKSSLSSSYPDCLNSEMKIKEFDFYTSVATDGSWRKGITLEDSIPEDLPSKGERQKPDCKTIFPLDYSVYTFEHLDAMQNRKTLVQYRELDLLRYVPPGTDLDTFGHRIANALLRNGSSWLHFNLAAIYWRIEGDAYNAIECARRAIFTAPREFRDIPLLTTGGILHAAERSAEAAIVLHTAIDLAPTKFPQYLALGHVYAVLRDYNRSLSCYDNSLKIAPALEQAKQAKHVVFCHQIFHETALEMFKTLDDVVKKLMSYQSDYEDMTTLRKKIFHELSTTVVLAKLGHEYVEAFLASEGRPETCVEHEAGKKSLPCSLSTGRKLLPQNLAIDIGVVIELSQNFQNLIEGISDHLKSSRASKVFPEYRAKKTRPPEFTKETTENEVASESLNFFTEPAARPKYHNNVIEKSEASSEDENWPAESECVGRSKISLETPEYVPVHLPPENKGFATHFFVNELIKIDPGKEHSLPWYPPACQPPEFYDEKHINPALLTASSNSATSPDQSLAPFITNLVKGAELAEIGQRILTAMKAKVAPPWILSVLASLHWRISGKPRHALDCLQQALNDVPDKFRDVPLVGIASIGEKFGFVDEALRTVRDALHTNSVEPTTNYLYATLLHAKGNNSGAIHHLKESLRVDPVLLEGRALELLRILTCDEKFSAQQSDDVSEVSGAENNGQSCLSPEIIVRHDLDKDETLLCVEDDEDCKSVRCFAMKINVDASTAP